MTAVLGLPKRLEGNALEPLKEQILAMRGQDLDLAGDDVERVNGLGVELLLATFRTWREDGVKLRIVEPTTALMDVFDRLSLGLSAGEAA